MRWSHDQLFHFILLIAVCLAPQVCIAQTHARNGMVVTANALASQVGVDILQQGGNAIDASIATAFALAVTHPTAGNIGGGGFLVYMDSAGSVTTIDFREKAPLAATGTMFLDEHGQLIPGKNRSTLMAVGVPGTVAGLFLAHQKYGRLPWPPLVQPAIDLAANGFPMSWAQYLEALQLFERADATPFIRGYFNDAEGNITQPGEIWQQPALAQTLAQIRDHGHDGFYKGPVAQEIERFMQRNGGIITKEDLAKYTAIERPAVLGTYKGYEIHSMAPPSSGGATLIQLLNMMELAHLDTIEFNSTSYVHLLAESMRRAYADRAEFLGDPDFNSEMPVDWLISKEHARQRFANLDWSKASISDPQRYGQPYDGDHTTHFSVIDKAGNAVSLTYTLEQAYGSKLGSPELGFIFNNEMGDFNPVPGVTTTSGQIGSAANIIESEKRMLSSMTPTIVAKDGRPYLIIGSPGGRTIINTVFQTILCVLAYDMPVDQAIAAMKIHHQWLPDRIMYERQLLSPDTRDALERMGHTLYPVNNLGNLMGILYDPELDVYIGAADKASPDGAAVGY
jgi:gamma-glutamyltranspeptidase / glutathione hydrolase